jgi:hypothetical protein
MLPSAFFRAPLVGATVLGVVFLPFVFSPCVIAFVDFGTGTTSVEGKDTVESPDVARQIALLILAVELDFAMAAN